MSDNTRLQVIGLTGTFASGKDTVAHFLKDNYNFLHLSTSDMVRQEALKLRGSIERPVLFEVGNELRRARGGGVFADIALERFKDVRHKYNGVVISGVRSLGEVKAIKAAGGTIIFVDAPIEMRYQRMASRQRDAETQLTLNDFKAREAKELHAPIGDDGAINIPGVKQMADEVIINDADLETFLAKMRQALHLASS